MKNFATVRTGVLSITLVLIAAGLWWMMHKEPVVVTEILSPTASTTNPTQSTTKPVAKPAISGTKKPASTATQKQYYNEQLRFGFSYPANLTISQELAPTYTASNTQTLKLGVYSIQGTNHILYGYIAVNQLIADTSPAQQKIVTSKTTVAGVVSSQRHITDAQSGFTKIDQLFAAGGNSYELQFEYSNAQTQAVANAITKSFYTR